VVDAPSPERLILVARAAGAFGVRGEIRLTAHTADPANLLTYGVLLREDGSTGLTLTEGRVAKGAVIARAKEVSTREEAKGLRGLRLYVARSALPETEEDEFYFADLIGLKALSPTGEAIGEVKSVMNFGAGDLLEVVPSDGGPSWWAPFTRDAVPEVRLAEGAVVVVRPEEPEA
jgi:16S rRNA processing protein RimM